MQRLLAILLVALGCTKASPPAVPGGDARRGADLAQAYGCGACHTIPGIKGARSQVGPALDNLRERVFLAGRLPNVPDSLIRWIVTPQLYQPGGAMPNLGISEADARDIAAYLYSLP